MKLELGWCSGARSVVRPGTRSHARLLARPSARVLAASARTSARLWDQTIGHPLGGAKRSASDSVSEASIPFRSVRLKLFSRYEFNAHGSPRFGISLGLFVDSLNTFSAPGKSSCIEIRYPGPDMQLLLRSIDSLDACIYAEIRTTIPDTISWDYNFEPIGSTPVTFTAKSAVLKEAIDDLEWPGSSIQINLQPDPPCVTFRGEGHGDLQIDFMYYANTDLLLAFHCDLKISYRYKYKFLWSTTSNIPSSVLKDKRGSKVTIGRGGMLKVQHLVSVARPSHPHIDSGGYQQPSRIAFIEFFVKPEEDCPAAAGAGCKNRILVPISEGVTRVKNQGAPDAADTLSNIPQTLSGECATPQDCTKGKIQRPKSRQAESCTIKCVTTCIRGGGGSPGEGPLNVRRPLVVFKDGFRSRRYCLVECSDICNLIKDGDDGP
ncbi:unnamed protein product [Rhodiola kirilowii]